MIKEFINQLAINIKIHISHEKELVGALGTLVMNKQFVYEQSS